jgi:TatD DNase family protein
MLIDTHCHIHESYPHPVAETIARAKEAGIEKMICVGTDESSSDMAVRAAEVYEEIYSAIGVHPHETRHGYGRIAEIAAQAPERLVAVGEIGLDYFYTHSPKEVQIEALRAQMDVALRHKLPIIFHVREAFDDFWPIFEELEEKYGSVPGVLHSFTDTKENMEKAVAKGLYIGVNGISTFTKDEAQKEMFDAIPLGSLLFETDAPFLTPKPFRGKINEPAYVELVASYHAERRNMSVQDIADATTRNAQKLFTF